MTVECFGYWCDSTDVQRAERLRQTFDGRVYLAGLLVPVDFLDGTTPVCACCKWVQPYSTAAAR